MIMYTFMYIHCRLSKRETSVVFNEVQAPPRVEKNSSPFSSQLDVSLHEICTRGKVHYSSGNERMPNRKMLGRQGKERLYLRFHNTWTQQDRTSWTSLATTFGEL